MPTCLSTPTCTYRLPLVSFEWPSWSWIVYQGHGKTCPGHALSTNGAICNEAQCFIRHYLLLLYVVLCRKMVGRQADKIGVGNSWRYPWLRSYWFSVASQSRLGLSSDDDDGDDDGDDEMTPMIAPTLVWLALKWLLLHHPSIQSFIRVSMHPSIHPSIHPTHTS